MHTTYTIHTGKGVITTQYTAQETPAKVSPEHQQNCWYNDTDWSVRVIVFPWEGNNSHHHHQDNGWRMFFKEVAIQN